MAFINRVDAGRRLASRLSHLAMKDVVVLGLPRGGVPVAFEVARALNAPLDVLVVRKLGAPGRPELAMGAIGEGGVRVLNRSVLAHTRTTAGELAAVERHERRELERRVDRFRGGGPPSQLQGRTALIVDDGIATGSTARAACQIARARGAARVVLAVPVAPPDRIAELERDADEVICLETPSHLGAVGEFYVDFSQTSDEEVCDLLARAAPPARDEEIRVEAGSVALPGRITVPDSAQALVLFAHGSGSSRHSPRNQYVADVLIRAGLGTLLFDLLTPEEAHDRANVFDIGLLAGRLTAATRWLRSRPDMKDKGIGYFGASTGAGAALWAAAAPDSPVRAVVSRGGRVDLAATRLAQVSAPTLLIVGGDDEPVLDLNRRAQAMLPCESRLVVVEGATHLFEEPGTLETAADLAKDWFLAHLPGGRQQARTDERPERLT
jgi:putative phosphoribosyl transferase